MSNRSSGRRRRGGRPSSNRGPNDGNRQGHRNSGNAHQLLDKYKNMARDAHQQGDRVMNEYYLQFADHYFRVLAEVNERKEEQKREREQRKSKDQDGGKPQKADAKSDKSDKSEKSGQNDAEAKPKRAAAKHEKAPDQQGGDLKISADALPGAIAVNGGEPEMNGKSPAKKAPARRKSKSDEGDGAAAEA